MARAQKRDAARSQQFIFRKEVFPLGQSRPVSVSSCGGCRDSTPGEKKEKALRNCFSPPTPPEEGIDQRPVEEEYTEMTMNQIINEGSASPIPQIIRTLHSNSNRATSLACYP